jgi:hypothetical protein
LPGELLEFTPDRLSEVVSPCSACPARWSPGWPVPAAASASVLASFGSLPHLRPAQRRGRRPLPGRRAAGRPAQRDHEKLAAWAAIIAVPTAVTGFYGQNIPYPGFGRHSGVITSCVIMIVLAGGLYWLLRRNDWL